MSFARALADWAGADAEDAGPLPLGSSLASIGRVARTISMLCEASFSLKGSLGAVGGWVASGAASLLVSASFSVNLGSFASLEEMLVVGRALFGLSLTSSVPEETGSALELEELEEPELCMA